MIETQHAINDMPSVTRYPRGNGYGEEILNDIYGLIGTNSSSMSTARCLPEGVPCPSAREES